MLSNSLYKFQDSRIYFGWKKWMWCITSWATHVLLEDTYVSFCVLSQKHTDVWSTCYKKQAEILAYKMILHTLQTLWYTLKCAYLVICFLQEFLIISQPVAYHTDKILWENLFPFPHIHCIYCVEFLPQYLTLPVISFRPFQKIIR